MATVSWKGAVTLETPGGAFPIHVRLYSRLKSRSGESFRTLAPNGQPISVRSFDTEGNEVDNDETSKGVERTKGEFIALQQDQLDLIASLQKSTIVDASAFCPLDSIDLTLNSQSYVVLPDKDVAGSEDPVEKLWNGLRATEMAYVTQLAMRAGSRDSIIALFAKDDGLYAVAIPFAEETWNVEPAQFKKDTKAGNVFAQFIEQQYADRIGPFDQAEFKSQWRERREQAIEAALGNAPMPEVPETPAAPDTPDLLAALEGAVKAKPKAKKRTTKKVAA